MITTSECQARDKTTCRYHTHTAGEIQAARALAADAGVKKSVADEIARNFEAREAERKAVFKQEWRERVPNWKNLGFQYPVSVRKMTAAQGSILGDTDVHQRWTEQERGAVRFFASNNYRWINPALYGERELTDDDSAPSILSYNMKHMSGHDVVEAPTKTQLAEVTNLLDSALQHERTDARVLYRGVNGGHAHIHGNTVEALHAYIDDAYPVNGVVEFKGYLSATANPKVALGYGTTNTGMGKREGLFFELLTKKGVALGSHALYTREDETLLPRDTKWRVAAVHKSRTVKYELQGHASWNTTKNQGTATIIQLVEI